MKLVQAIGSAIIASIPTYAMAQALPLDCPRLADESAYSAQLSFLAPLRADPVSGWITRGSDERTDFGFSADGVALMGMLVGILEARYGTHLVTVVPPPRGMFAPHTRDKEAVALRYARLLDQLRRAGAIVPDVWSEVQSTAGGPQDFYFKTDTHWTPFGALLAARATGRAIAASGLINLPPVGTHFSITDSPEKMEQAGTIIRAVKEICGYEVPPEIVEVPVIVPVAQPNTTTLAGLFGDQAAASVNDVVLVGTSFTNLSGRDRLRWGDGLKLALQTDLSNRGLGGGSFAGSINAYALDGLAEERPNILIWEFLHAYVWNSTAGQVREILGNVMGTCPVGGDTAETAVNVDDTNWHVLAQVPAGHDFVELKLNGMQQGQTEFSLVSDGGASLRTRFVRDDRVEPSARSDIWAFYSGDPLAAEGAKSASGELSVRLDRMALPVNGRLRTCAAVYTRR